jgi:hypothetical protein
VIPKAWHWRAAERGRGDKHDVSPKLTASGDLDESGPGGVLLPANTRNWGHRLLRSIPIRKEGASTSYQPEFREPFVLAYRDTAPTGYFYVDQPSSLDDIPGSVRMLDADFGFEVRMSPRHQLAKNHWGGATASLTPAPKYDWEKLVATVAVETDERFRAEVDVADGDADRVLEIYVEDASLWWIAPDTVTDVTNGALVRAYTASEFPTGKVLRSDATRLQRVAALAQAWYGRSRAVLELSAQGLNFDYPIGYYISGVFDDFTSEDVNGVVTTLEYDLAKFTTRIVANYKDVDFTGGPPVRLPRLHN